eukprot:scaffold158317_cov28-Tisochrysis_lutea.AAC.3
MASRRPGVRGALGEERGRRRKRVGEGGLEPPQRSQCSGQPACPFASEPSVASPAASHSRKPHLHGPLQRISGHDRVIVRVEKQERRRDLRKALVTRCRRVVVVDRLVAERAGAGARATERPRMLPRVPVHRTASRLCRPLHRPCGRGAHPYCRLVTASSSSRIELAHEASSSSTRKCPLPSQRATGRTSPVLGSRYWWRAAAHSVRSDLPRLRS